MFTVEINDTEVDAALQKLSDHLSDMTEIFEVLGDLLQETTGQRLEEGVSPDGIAWAPKSETTIQAYRARGFEPNFKPLFGPNLDVFALSDQESYFHRASPTQLEIGTNEIQAAVMQFGKAQGAFGTTARGGSIPWGDIPARPFLGISESDRGLIHEIIEDWLESATG